MRLTAAAQQRADAILVASDPFLSSRQEYVAILARRFGLPSFSIRSDCRRGGANGQLCA